MRLVTISCLIMASIAAGCALKTLPAVTVKIPTRTIEYSSEVKPILDKRCTVCHSCYNSPCQLKLDSFEGADRGASKRAIYNAARLTTMDPTRLFIDARTTEEWRKKQFFSITDSSVGNGLNDSIMIQLLSHKMKNPASSGEYHAEADDLTCSENRNELAGYLDKHPNNGMPFGFPPLKQDEFDIIAGWLVQGARGPTPDQQAQLVTPKPEDARAILRWESFLNQTDPKHAMTARYLYEHLFLAHINFATGSNEFFELVRSRTAPGQPVEVIPTVRPYDDPGPEPFFYRFRKIHSTIVHKTHMVFDLDDAQFQRINELFIQPEWLQTPHTMGYEPVMSANPFTAFEQIPPRSRYQFLLDNAHYIIMTFIHGPVCKGQIALNVIDDHFWVMFMDPDHDLSVAYPGFLRLHAGKLRMPIEKGSNQHIFSALTDEHRKAVIEFYRARQDYYAAHYYAGLDYDFIWKGNRPADAPLLTVYRHFNSASVHRGILGSLPKTMWVIDYPLLERIYYALVAGFDVYGTAGHQLAIRLYMDALRVEGESNFLDFLPPAKRKAIMKSWYKGVELKKVNYYPSLLPAGIVFTSDDPKREFIEQLVNRHLLPASGIAFDPINYLPAGTAYPQLPHNYEKREDYLRAFTALSRPGTPFFSLIKETDANLAYVRIRLKNGRDIAGSIVINRWHDNVAFMLGEDDRLDASKDSADFIPGLIGSYPNYFVDVREEELPDFFDLLANFSGSRRDLERVARYGVNRADDRLWEAYDWFQMRFMKDEPVKGGLFDLNRYFHRAR
ncbi:fatty acid cis/trans isomerase [Pelobacter propionicus]|uniref:Fatty acid cis/trans isomerase, putative n=1 Tax=Pelobacter propionicus (strain DSM 2379 / NBRC 103807 / OttBd1) TaxID=338966 RepID=A1AQQ2_PELPD|nr:fatty acid cis/trans isomerase [Pelobacter propionicus]ABK99672.1 fatty acid cis/trans isomerase, putative [Pelobacter propionicus DSM 2379]